WWGDAPDRAVDARRGGRRRGRLLGPGAPLPLQSRPASGPAGVLERPAAVRIRAELRPGRGDRPADSLHGWPDRALPPPSRVRLAARAAARLLRGDSRSIHLSLPPTPAPDALAVAPPHGAPPHPRR